MRGLHYGQELASTNRPDTFAQTKPPRQRFSLQSGGGPYNFHGLLFARATLGFTATSTSAMGRTRKEVFIVIVVDECFGDLALTEMKADDNGLYLQWDSSMHKCGPFLLDAY
jgi:hypothetical protein